MKWHDCALPAVYYDLRRHDDFEVMPRWWELKLLHVCENYRAKILWEVPIPMDGDIVARRPDALFQGKMNRHLYLIEMVVAWDSIQERRAEKQSKYVGTLRRLAETVPGYRMDIVPLAIGSLGTVTHCLVEDLRCLPVINIVP